MKRPPDSLSTVADMQRAGRIRGDKLDDGALTRASLVVTVRRTKIEDARELGLIRGRRKMEVDEARTRELNFRDEIARGQCVDDRLCQLAWVRACGLGELHRDVCREVAVRCVARALDVHRRARDVSGKNVRRQGGQRGAYELLDLVFQSGIYGVVSEPRV